MVEEAEPVAETVVESEVAPVEEAQETTTTENK